MDDIHYLKELTFEDFHDDNSWVKGVLGPVGSGKTTGCCFDIFKRCNDQRPHKRGGRLIRSSRWGFVRATFPELQTTTLKTWMENFEHFTKMRMSPPMNGKMIYPHEDGESIVEAELWFLALEKPKDVDKLSSLEFTGVFINEGSELIKEVFDKCTERIGRFPPKKWGGPTWTGVIMDTNACDDDHWWYKFSEELNPIGYSFYKQPAALLKFRDKDELASFFKVNPRYLSSLEGEGLQDVDTFAEFMDIMTQIKDNYGPYLVYDGKGYLYIPNPLSENAINQSLGYRYWTMKVAGKSINYINVQLLNEYGNVGGGVPVYPDYTEAIHLAKEELKPLLNVGITLGFDFGLKPACSFSQITPLGTKILFDEQLVTEHGALGFKRFSRCIVVPYLLKNFLPWLQSGLIIGWGDPAGVQRTQTDEITCYMIAGETPTTKTDNYLKSRELLLDKNHVKKLIKISEADDEGKVSLADIGVKLRPAHTNSFEARRTAVTNWLTARVDGNPAFQISPRCRYLKKAFRGAFKFERKQVAGEATFKNEPKKNIYSHISDAYQYDCLEAACETSEPLSEAEETMAAQIQRLSGIDMVAHNELQKLKQGEEEWVWS